MNDLTNNIYQAVSGGDNLLLVGPTDSGKTWYINNILIPFFREKKMRVVYFSNPDNISKNNKADIIIVDEVEVLIDQDKLEASSSGHEPYYSEVYLNKVKAWHNKLQKLTAPSIFVLTRNNKKEISNIVDNVVTTDWGAKVKCLAFNVSKS